MRTNTYRNGSDTISIEATTITTTTLRPPLQVRNNNSNNMKRRNCYNNNYYTSNISLWMALTAQVVLLFPFLMTVYADDSVTPQQSPRSAPTTILVTQTPISLSTTTTNAPIEVPTLRPVGTPTRRPTGRPISLSPTISPIATTTDTPTSEPTNPPSPKPVVEESVAPSEKPSIAPSRSPSKTPSVSPKPTSVTISPTISSSPTKNPTLAPTRAPQEKPVSKPTSTTNTKPVAVISTPTFTPTYTPQNSLVSVDVILSGLDTKLQTTLSQNVFKTVTGDFIYFSLQEFDFKDVVTILDVNVNIVSQQFVEETERRNQQRFLATDVRIRYNALIEYQSSNGDDTESVSEWVNAIFNTNDNQRNSYLTQLRKADDDNTFDVVDGVIVHVDGIESPQQPDDVIDEKSSENNNGFFSNENLWYIIGAVGGTICIIIIILTIYMMGRNKQRKRMDAIYDGKPNMTTITKIKNQFSYDSDHSPTNQLHYTAEIDVDLHNDDVSTLGDPTYYYNGGAPDQATVQPISQQHLLEQPPYSNNNSNTVQKMYYPSTNTTIPRERFLSEESTDDHIRYSESNLLKQNDDENADIVVHTIIDDSANDPIVAGDHDENNIGNDDLFEPMSSSSNKNTMMMTQQQQMKSSGNNVIGSKYAVEVPPGKLGMIIDTPDNGSPVVHTIKPESILCATVQAGDYLISVDDEIVTHMTAVQVSKLISIKSDQQRKLVFLRKPIQRNRINSSSSDYFVEQNGAC